MTSSDGIHTSLGSWDLASKPEPGNKEVCAGRRAGREKGRETAVLGQGQAGGDSGDPGRGLWCHPTPSPNPGALAAQNPGARTSYQQGPA